MTVTASAALAAFPVINSVTFGGTAMNPVITLSGSDFGAMPAADPGIPIDNTGPFYPCSSNTNPGPVGSDYDSNLYLSVANASGQLPLNAGRYVASGPLTQYDCVGLLVSSFTPTQIVYSLGSYYQAYYGTQFALAEGNTIKADVNGASATLAVHYGTTVPNPTAGTQPGIAIVTPANGATFTQGQKVAASYACIPTAGSTIASCAGDVAVGATVDTGSPGVKTFTVTTAASNGLTATQTITYTVVAVKPTVPPTTPVAALAIAAQNAKVATNGKLVVKLTCAGAPCTGTLALTTAVKKSTGKSAHKHTTKITKMIGTATFSKLAVGKHSVSVKLNGTGRSLLKTDRYKLSSMATGTYASGSVAKQARGSVSLKGTKPKPKPKKKK